MKKIVSLIALGSILATNVMAGKLYGGAGLALVDVDPYDNGIALVLTGGIKMDEIVPNLVFEGELTYSVVSPSFDFNLGTSSTIDLDILNLGVYAGYNFNIPNTKVTIKPRLGLNYQNWSVSTSNGFNNFGNNDGDIALSYGVSALYPMGNGLTAYVDFTDKGSSNNLGVGVQMAF